MNIKIKIGSAMLEFEGRDYKEVCKEASAFSQATKCGCCKSTNVAIDYHYGIAKEGEKKGQGFDYYSIKCMDCWSKVQLGQYKTGGWFVKKWEKWDKSPSTKQQSPEDEVPFDFEDIKA